MQKKTAMRSFDTQNVAIYSQISLKSGEPCDMQGSPFFYLRIVFSKKSSNVETMP